MTIQRPLHAGDPGAQQSQILLSSKELSWLWTLPEFKLSLIAYDVGAGNSKHNALSDTP